MRVGLIMIFLTKNTFFFFCIIIEQKPEDASLWSSHIVYLNGWTDLGLPTIGAQVGMGGVINVSSGLGNATRNQWYWLIYKGSVKPGQKKAL